MQETRRKAVASEERIRTISDGRNRLMGRQGGLAVDLEPSGRNGYRPVSGIYHGETESRVSEFSVHGAGNVYVDSLVSVMDASPEWNVLDIGGASGDLAIPLAGKVRSVKVVHLSRDSFDLTRYRCREKKVGNLSSLLVLPEYIRDGHDLGRYDAVIVAASLLPEDSPYSIMALDNAAKRKVFICACVGDGPFDRRVFEAAGRKLEMGPSYTRVYYNIIHNHLGVLPDITFVEEVRPCEWDSIEEAVDAHRWMFYGITEEEEDGIRRFLQEQLVDVNGKLRLPYERKCKWAIMGWQKKEWRARDRSKERRSRRVVTPPTPETKIAFE